YLFGINSDFTQIVAFYRTSLKQRRPVERHDLCEVRVDAEEVVPLPAAGVVRRDELRAGINRHSQRLLGGIARRGLWLGLRGQRRKDFQPLRVRGFGRARWR